MCWPLLAHTVGPLAAGRLLPDLFGFSVNWVHLSSPTDSVLTDRTSRRMLSMTSEYAAAMIALSVPVVSLLLESHQLAE